MWESKYFKRSEFACKCGCGFDTVDYGLVKLLEAIREHFDRPLIINSACRCPSHNKVEGGAAHSQHVRGRAADIVVKDVPPEIVAELADNLNAGGIGRHDTFTHVDTRNGKWRG